MSVGRSVLITDILFLSSVLIGVVVFRCWHIPARECSCSCSISPTSTLWPELVRKYSSALAVWLLKPSSIPSTFSLRLVKRFNCFRACVHSTMLLVKTFSSMVLYLYGFKLPSMLVSILTIQYCSISSCCWGIGSFTAKSKSLLNNLNMHNTPWMSLALILLWPSVAGSCRYSK